MKLRRLLGPSSEELDKYLSIQESKGPQGEYVRRHERPVLNLGWMAVGGGALALSLRVGSAFSGNADPSSVLPDDLLTSSLGLLAATFGFRFFSINRHLAKLERFDQEGVDVYEFNDSRRERLKRMGKTVLVGATASAVYAGTINIPHDDAVVTQQGKVSFVNKGHLVQPYNFEKGYIQEEDIECNVGLTSGSNAKEEIDRAGTVLPSNPDIFKLLGSGKVNAVNSVFVSAYDDSGFKYRFDHFDITASGKNLEIFNVSDTFVNLSKPQPSYTPYVGKNSPANSYVFHNNNEFDATFGITDMGVLREGDNYYLGLACNTESLFQGSTAG